MSFLGFAKFIRLFIIEISILRTSSPLPRDSIAWFLPSFFMPRDGIARQRSRALPIVYRWLSGAEALPINSQLAS